MSWVLLLFRHEADRDRIGAHYQLMLLVHKWLELDVAAREDAGRHHHGMLIMRSRWCLCQYIAWRSAKRRSSRHDHVLMLMLLLLPRMMSRQGDLCVFRTKQAGRRRRHWLLILRKRRICHRHVRNCRDESTRNRNEGGAGITTPVSSLMRLLILRQHHGGIRHHLEVGLLVKVLYRDETSLRVAKAVSCSLAAEGSMISLAHTIMNGHDIKMRKVISVETFLFVNMHNHTYHPNPLRCRICNRQTVIRRSSVNLGLLRIE